MNELRNKLWNKWCDKISDDAYKVGGVKNLSVMLIAVAACGIIIGIALRLLLHD